MTPYRERRLAKADRLRGYAEKREADAAAVFKAGEPFTTDHAFNTQPGHIPFRAKLIAREDRAHESLAKAGGMADRADAIEAQAAHAIYSDDDDATDRLAERIAKLEAERDRIKAFNASCRKGTPDESLLDGRQRAGLASARRYAPYQLGKGGSMPAYELSNLSGNINRQRKRLAEITATKAVVEDGGRGSGRMMLSRFASECAACSAEIEKGSPIVYYRATREAVHSTCA